MAEAAGTPSNGTLRRGAQKAAHEIFGLNNWNTSARAICRPVSETTVTAKRSNTCENGPRSRLLKLWRTANNVKRLKDITNADNAMLGRCAETSEFSTLLNGNSRYRARDTVSEWLRRWTRNPLGSARRGSNPLGVDFVIIYLRPNDPLFDCIQ